MKSERDKFAKQLEELSRLRQTEQEAVFEKYKKEADERAKCESAILLLIITVGELTGHSTGKDDRDCYRSRYETRSEDI